ncbi:MAG TPA: response regulator [Microvirga sp.]|nr:response regulator [Microvirga sp.]
MTMDSSTILVVEDNPDDRDLLARAFRKAGIAMPIRFAVDGEEAVAYLGGTPGTAPEGRPAVILLDLKLPGRSGFEVLEWIKNHPVLRRVPVIILTSSREDVDLRRAYDLGANSYLVKPARSDDLLRMVEQIHAYWVGFNQAPTPL